MKEIEPASTVSLPIPGDSNHDQMDRDLIALDVLFREEQMDIPDKASA